MAWITSNSVSVSNGSKTVSVSGNVDLSSVDEGWGVQIGENKLVEASSGTAPNGSGVSTLTLFEPWPNGSVSAATMKIIPNSGYQIALAKRIKSIVDRTVDVMQLQHDYASQLGQVTATDPETNEQHVYNTLRQNQQEIDALIESFGTSAGYDVTASATDAGNGANGKPKLLKVGDSGVMTAGLDSGDVDIDTITGNGTYFINLANTITGDIPNFSMGSAFILSVASGSTSKSNATPSYRRVCQTAFGYASRDIFFRFRISSTVWSDWQAILHTGNTGSIVNKDYETGFWTPVIGASYGNLAGATIKSSSNCRYTKIGNVVRVSGALVLENFASASPLIGDRFVLTGAPFLSVYAFTPVGTAVLYNLFSNNSLAHFDVTIANDSIGFNLNRVNMINYTDKAINFEISYTTN